MSYIKDLKIFKLNRLKFSELYDDCVSYLKRTYQISDDRLSQASPFNIFLKVILNLWKMTVFYIEDSITNLSLATSYRPDSIRALATLTGHTPSRPISARGAGRLIFKNTGNLELTGKTICNIPNRIKIQSTLNGCSYIILMNAEVGSLDISTAGNYLNVFLIQGTIKTQSATSNGQPLQSYAFSERSYRQPDEYYINVYVNGERIEIVNSLLDLGFNQKGCVVKSSMVGTNDGISIFFGNGDYGFVPEEGATIIVEYIVSDGIAGNLNKETVNQADMPWKFNGQAFMSDGTQISINDNFYLSLDTDIIFGSQGEDITLTQMIAPHVSRANVLASETNYEYFLRRMNMFKDIEVIKGYSSKDMNTQARIAYDKTVKEYNEALNKWQDLVLQYGDDSEVTKAQYIEVQKLINAVSVAQEKVEETDMKDNTVYLLLIPDISKRMSSAHNYFTCPEDTFTLTENEQYNIIQLIEDSGQKIITMETRILNPKIARFSINANVKIWEGYNVQSVYADSLQKISDYLINMTRKDMIPLSDITALLEGVEGIDSVKVWFDADKDNELVYGKEGFYGIDNFGDIILTRNYVSGTGMSREVRDILPLFRGGFVSPSGVEYSELQSDEHNSAFNLNLVSYTRNTKLSLENPVN